MTRQTQVGTPCPRCGGSLIPDQDRTGEYLSCLQCGNLIDLVDGQVDTALPEKKNEPRVRRKMPWEA